MAMWGKAVLLVGLGLTAIAAFEIGEAALGAQEQTHRSTPSAQHPSRQAVSDDAQTAPSHLPTPPDAAIITDAPPVDSIATATLTLEEALSPDEPSPDEPSPVNSSENSLDASSAEASTQAKTYAIESGTPNGVQPNVTNISPEEFAIAAWAGASFPVENFQAYTSPFGYRRSPTGGYRQEFHYGLDMAAPQGSYIRSWWSGKVVELTDNTNCGTSIVIQSGDWTHIYCHMQGSVEVQDGRSYLIDRDGGIQIWDGQDIQAGDRIGRVGMTGRTTGPHLHWGLKYSGNWVDPAFVISAMVVSQQAMGR